MYVLQITDMTFFTNQCKKPSSASIGRTIFSNIEYNFIAHVALETSLSPDFTIAYS